MTSVKATIFFLLSIFPLFSISQTLNSYHGAPLLENFTSHDFKHISATWDITQDQRGVMYFATDNGLVQYDGATWRVYSLGNNSVAKSIDVDSNGIIYAGGINDFGYFVPNANGKLIYNSLSSHLPDSLSSFQDIRDISVTKDGVCFFSNQHLFKWHNNKITIVPTPENMAVLSDRENIYIALRNQGVFVLKNNKLTKLTHDNELFYNAGYIDMMHYDKNTILIATTAKGFHLYNIQTNTISSFPIDEKINDYLLKNSKYSSLKISPELFAFGTKKEGIIILNNKGELDKVINMQRGLYNNRVYCMFIDSDNNLWAGTKSCISRIDLDFSTIKYTRNQGLKSSVKDTEWYNGIKYIAANDNLYYLKDYSLSLTDDNHIVIPVKGIGKCLALETAEGHLVAATSRGLSQIIGDRAIEILKVRQMYTLTYSKMFPNKIFTSTKYHFAIADIQSNGKTISISNYRTVDGDYDKIKEVTIDTHGNFWLATETQGIILLKFKDKQCKKYSFTILDERNGLPSNLTHLNIKNINGDINVFTQKGVYKPVLAGNNKADSLIRFVHDEKWGDLFTKDSTRVLQINQIKKDVFLLDTGKLGLLNKKNDSDVFYTSPFNRLERPEYISVEKNGIINIASSDILYVYNISKKTNLRKSFYCLIRRVVSANDSIIFDGAFSVNNGSNIGEVVNSQPENFIPTLDYKHNSISIEFSSSFYKQSDKTTYQYYLDGFDSNWNEWTTETKAIYTNIPEGHYCFQVKAKNIYETESEISSYEFVVLPPWYRSLMAYFAYVILVLIIFWRAVKFYTKQLRERNLRLEEIVAERTADLNSANIVLKEQQAGLEEQKEEILVQNEEILQQKNEVERQNLLINDSIRYAKTIQDAILPTGELMKQFFEFFVLFRPKDIVSGDFYWFLPIPSFENEPICFAAAVDCTGHGVPGAFMSMVGSRLLNEIVGERKIHQPAEILEALNQGIKTALRQEQNENDDGMEIGLAKIEKSENNTWNVIFSGAKRPMIFYSAQESILTKIKGDVKPIGGKHYANQVYTQKDIILSRGDVLYLTTDGLIDQNNYDRKRFGSKKLHKILQYIGKFDMDKQKKILENELDGFQVLEKQRDDITVLGLKL